mgnify:CR=1 FL=1
MRSGSKPFATGFKFLGIALDIVIFTFLGYFIGKNFGHEVLGALLGALFGTALTWYYLFKAAGRIEFKK